MVLRIAVYLYAQTYEAISTHFEAMGTYFGGCGVPVELLKWPHLGTIWIEGLNLSKPNETAGITNFDIRGSVVEKVKIAGTGRMEITSAILPNGIYTVLVQVNNQKITHTVYSIR